MSPTPPSIQNVDGISPLSQATYSIISAVAFIGNTLVILVFVWDKKLLKKSYNKFILSLAIADVLTAINLITNPAFVLGDEFPYPTSPFLGEIFCRLIWSRVFLFQLVTFSAYMCLGLTAERWFAVVQPHKYSGILSRSKVIAYIITSCAWSFLLTSSGVIETVYSPSSTQLCEFQFISRGSVARVLAGIFQITMKMFFPCLVMIGLYIHMVLTARGSAVASAASKAKLRGNMTRMVGVTCFILIICFAPNQIFLLLSYAGKTTLDSTTHHALALLTFISSCVNPVIYGLSNKTYRQSYKKILFALCPRMFGGSVREANGIGFVNRRQRVEPSPQPTWNRQSVKTV